VTPFAKFDEYVRAHSRQYVDELKELIRLPTVSAQKRAIDETGAAVLERAKRAGIAAELLRSNGGPPTIVGETGSGSRALLVYDHYDVQPPDPEHEWQTPPFEPTERDGMLFGRGVSDNKGNLMARLQAIEAYRASLGELPLRIRVLFEGEEEIGSEHLGDFVKENAERLRADGCIWEAGYKDAAGRPTISLGLKGIAYFELRVRGPKKDVHSSQATIIPNPAWRLVWALGTLKDANDRITIDGLWDHVRPASAADVALLEQLPYDEAEVKRIHGIDAFVRGLGGTPLKLKHFFEPTCTICGLTSGYSGPGSKTVLPAVASAKLDFRLVPDLEPDLVGTLLRAHLDKRGFSDAYGTDPVVYPLMVGSGPMSQVCDQLQIPVVGFGAGNASSANHAPNENIAIVDYVDHIRAFGRFLHLFAGRPLA
jgi:acetylornithine deacetylase/succinyl-diaminopimelate desuccinylase-like protein